MQVGIITGFHNTRAEGSYQKVKRYDYQTTAREKVKKTTFKRSLALE